MNELQRLSKLHEAIVQETRLNEVLLALDALNNGLDIEAYLYKRVEELDT